MNGAVNGIPRTKPDRPRTTYNPRQNLIRPPQRTAPLSKFGSAGAVTKAPPGLSVGGFFFRRLLGPVGAFFIPTPLGDGTLPDVWRKNDPDGFHLEPSMFYKAYPGGAEINLPRGFESFERELNAGRFNLIDVPPAYYSPVETEILPLDQVLAPGRAIGNAFRRAEKERLRLVSRSSVNSLTSVYDQVLNAPLPYMPSYQPIYPAVTPYGPGPNPNNYWTYDTVTSFNPDGTVKFTYVRRFDQVSYDRDYQNWLQQNLLIDQINADRRAEAENEAAAKAEAEYQANVIRVGTNNAGFEFVTSREKPQTAKHVGRYRRQKNDGKNQMTMGYMRGLTFINRTAGREIFDTVTAFLDNLELDHKYINGDPRKRKYLEGFNSYWDRENQRWVYRPKNALAAFRAYQDGILQFDDMGFYQDVAFNRQIDRLYGRLSKGIKENVNRSGFSNRPVGVSAGPAL